MKDLVDYYKTDLVAFIEEVWTTEDFCQPVSHTGLRGSTVEKLPTYELTLDQNVIDWPELNVLEDAIYSEMEKQWAKEIDAEIFKQLCGGIFIECEIKNGSRESYLGKSFSNPEKLEDKYSDYERAMSSVINMTGV